jgi:hypothetical protein
VAFVELFTNSVDFKENSLFLLKAANLIHRLQLACDNHFSSDFIWNDFKAFDLFNMALCTICMYLAFIFGSNSFALFATSPT